MNGPCTRPHIHTQPRRRLSSAAKLLYSTRVSYINDLSDPRPFPSHFGARQTQNNLLN